MNLPHVLGVVVASGLLLYLFRCLLKPEDLP